MYLGASDIEVELNDTFTLGLYVDVTAPADSILSWGLDLDLSDSSLLNLNSFMLGSNFMSVPSDDGIGGAAFGPLFGSNILLGTFEFTAVDFGSTVASTSNSLGDIFEGFTTTNFFGPSVFNSASANIRVVSAVSTVPEPSTLAIFALGIMGLASRRFKKR